MPTITPIQKILKGILHTHKTKTNITMKGQEVLNLTRKADKYLGRSTELAAHTQFLKQ
jgi:hypothetical protein